MLASLPILFLLLPQGGVSQRLEVGPDGVRIVQDVRAGTGLRRRPDSGGRTGLVSAARWSEADGGLAWIGTSVAVGDDGATVLAGKTLNNQEVTLYPGGSAAPVFRVPAPGAQMIGTAVASHAGLTGVYTVLDMDPAPATWDYEATVSAWPAEGALAPLWSVTFPRTGNHFGGGVAVSDDGTRILAWKGDPNTQSLHVEAYLADGTPLSSGSLAVVSGPSTYFSSRQTRLSDDGTRAYFNLGPFAILYDVASATVLHQHSLGASFDSHALSGDGRRFAYGSFGQFQVWEESTPGTWTQAALETFPGNTYVAWLDLDADGSHLAFQVQRFSPAMDHIETGLYAVDTGQFLFNRAMDAPGTVYQLAASGVAVDAAGEVVAGSSWGDSFGLNPELFAYDAAGNLTAALALGGSAFTLALDAAGDVLAAGSKAVHANEFGNGGAIWVADAQDHDLHLAGFPQGGGSVQLQAGPTGNFLRVAVVTDLGSSPSPFGATELDLSTLKRLLGPFAIPPGGLDVPLAIPPKPAILGRIFHLQGAITGGGPGHLTNRVSLRILP